MATSGLPTGRNQYPAGTDSGRIVAYNRALKVARIVAKALELGCDAELTDEQIDAIAHEIGVNPPGSAETRAAVRAALADPLTHTDHETAFGLAVTGAAYNGTPFRYRDAEGRTVMFVPIPTDR